MSEISRRIIEEVRNWMIDLSSEPDPWPYIPLEGDLEQRLDHLLLDAVFPVRDTTGK